MKAVQVTVLDGPESISVADVEAPAPGAGEVLIDVAYAGVTFPELLQTRGLYQVKHPLPFTLGSEAAGVVAAVGADVTDLAVGDRVATIAGKGAYAEAMVAPANATVKLPDSVSLSAAAGMPMNLLTADFALRVRGRLEAGQTVLVHGAAGGLGTALVQVAVAMGATVVGVVSTEEKAETVKSLGAQHAVLSEGFKDAVKELFPAGVDLVADPVGNPEDGDRRPDPAGQGQPPPAQQRGRRRCGLGRGVRAGPGPHRQPVGGAPRAPGRREAGPRRPRDVPAGAGDGGHPAAGDPGRARQGAAPGEGGGLI
jgi:NADPH2:quinone reductase